MNDEINYKTNPLHGLSLKNLLIELEGHYGFKILYAYLNINCFRTNPSIESSVKFLKKTDWAREKVEAFYLYQFKSLPKASYDQAQLPPRDRVVPEDQVPGEPAELTLEEAEKLTEERAKKAADFDSNKRSRSGARSGSHSEQGKGSSAQRSDPYGKRRDDDQRHDEPKQQRSSDAPKKSSSDEAPSTTPDPWAKWRK